MYHGWEETGEINLNITLLLKHGIGTKTSSAQSIIGRCLPQGWEEAAMKTLKYMTFSILSPACGVTFHMMLCPSVCSSFNTNWGNNSFSKSSLLSFSVWEMSSLHIQQLSYMNQRLLFFYWKSCNQTNKSPTQRYFFFFLLTKWLLYYYLFLLLLASDIEIPF